MRIIIFSYFFDPFVGGAEVAIKEVFRRISKTHEVHLITPRKQKELTKNEIIEGINVHRVGCGKSIDARLFIFSGALYAARLHKKKNFDISFALMVNQAAICQMIFNKIVSKKPKSVLNIQSGDSLDYVKNHIPFGFWWLYKKIYVSFDQIIVISNFLKKRAESFGCDPSRITVIPNGVDLEVFTNVKSEDKKFTIVTASRLAYKNNIVAVIEAMKYLDEKYQFTIIGDGELRKELEQQADKINRKIKFLGFIPNKDLPSYLRGSGVFIRPSFSEGFGNSFIEAMALKVPIIGTNVGGIPDFLKDQETGLFCDPNNPKDIAEKIKQICENQELRDKIIKQGFEEAKKYSWEKISKLMEEELLK